MKAMIQWEKACQNGNLSAIRECLVLREQEQRQARIEDGYAYKANAIQKDWDEKIDVGFHRACQGGHLDVVKFLLTSQEMKNANLHVNVHSKFDYGFRVACEYGQLEVVKYLLTSKELIEAGHTFADLHAWDDGGFVEACRNGQLNVVKYLLTSQDLIEAGHSWVEMNEKNSGFIMACATGHWEVVAWLVLDYGIEKTPKINNYMKAYAQVEDLFKIREEKEILTRSLKIDESGQGDDGDEIKKSERADKTCEGFCHKVKETATHDLEKKQTLSVDCARKIKKL